MHTASNNCLMRSETVPVSRVKPSGDWSKMGVIVIVAQRERKEYTCGVIVIVAQRERKEFNMGP